MSFVYEYPRPMVTVDLVILRVQLKELQVLLIQRKNEPFARKWALPGGFIGMEETLSEAAARELQEETGISNCRLVPLLQADEPIRDPRGRTISHVFGTILTYSPVAARAGDDASAVGWFSLNNLPSLAFDHQKIVDGAVSELQHLSLFKLAVLDFLEKKFSGNELVKICTVLFNEPEISNVILEIALKLQIIQKLENNFYQRTTMNAFFQPPDFFKLLSCWMNQRSSG